MKELREISRRLGSKIRDLKMDLQHQVVELMALAPDCAIEFTFVFNEIKYSAVIEIDAFVIAWLEDEEQAGQLEEYGVLVDGVEEKQPNAMVLNLCDLNNFSSDEILLVRGIMYTLITAYTKKLKEVEEEINDNFNDYLNGLFGRYYNCE